MSDARKSLGHCKLLLVEDERATREIVVSMLKSIGVTDVTEAPSAEMAWSYLVGTQRRGFHAVIADLGLPGISGIKLIKKLRAMPSPRAKELPIIVVTATNDLTTFKKLEAQNISSYLIKPISAGLLQSAIEKALAAG